MPAAKPVTVLLNPPPFKPEAVTVIPAPLTNPETVLYSKPNNVTAVQPLAVIEPLSVAAVPLTRLLTVVTEARVLIPLPLTGICIVEAEPPLTIIFAS